MVQGTSDGFAVQTSTVDDIAVVRATGDLDAASTQRLAAAFDDALDASGRHVVFDATGVEFADSTGISEIVGVQRRLNRTRRRLAVACGRGPLYRALEVTGLLHSLEVHPTADDAIAAVASAPLLGR